MEILKMSLCICLLFEMNYLTKSETNIFKSNDFQTKYKDTVYV